MIYHDIEYDKDIENKFGEPDWEKSRFDITNRIWLTPIKNCPNLYRIDDEKQYNKI